jgi:hypothetical protein
MRIQCKYRGIKGFVRIYNYAIKQNYMITKTAKKRHEIKSEGCDWKFALTWRKIR